MPSPPRYYRYQKTPKTFMWLSKVDQMLIVTTMHNPMKFDIECITSKGTHWNPYSHSSLKGPHKRNTNAPTLYLMHVSFKVDLIFIEHHTSCSSIDYLSS